MWIIVILVVCIFVLYFRRKMKMHLRGTGLGAGLAGGHEDDELSQRRIDRYVRGASRENRDKADKALKKANKTRLGWRWLKLMDKYDDETSKAAQMERFARSNVKMTSGGKSHGIRKAGSERGRKL